MRKGFTMISNRSIEELAEQIKDSNASPLSMLVYIQLLSMKGKNSSRAHPSQEFLLTACQCSKGGLIKSLKFLEDTGFILVIRKHMQNNIYFFPKEEEYINGYVSIEYTNKIHSLSKTAWLEYEQRHIEPRMIDLF